MVKRLSSAQCGSYKNTYSHGSDRSTSQSGFRWNYLIIGLINTISQRSAAYSISSWSVNIDSNIVKNSLCKGTARLLIFSQAIDLIKRSSIKLLASAENIPIQANQNIMATLTDLQLTIESRQDSLQSFQYKS